MASSFSAISEQTNVVTKGFDIYNWKNILAEEVKAEEKETSKEVKDKQEAYDATDVKNADNINGNEIWKGYYAEMKDPANANKTGDELKKIVVKNLSKDPLYYTKNGEFGVKGLGYTDEAPGLGKNTQPTSKNASILGGRDEVNSDSDVVKNSLIGLIKKNVKDTLSGSEAKISMPKKVKEMSVTPQNSKGVKKMDMPGKEKRIKLKEGLSLAELLAEVTKEIVDETPLNENSPIGKTYFVDQEHLRDAWREIEDEVIEDEGYNDEDLKDFNVDNKLYKITSDRFLTKYGKTFSDFAQNLPSKLKYEDEEDKEAEFDFGPDNTDPAGGYGPRSHMEEADTVRTGNKDYHGIEKYQTTKQTTKGGQFDPKYWEDKDKKSKIPQFTFLPKEIVTKINNKYPGSIQIISQGEDLSMFISQFFYMALSETTRGRYSQDIERKKTELTRYISEVMPPFTRGLIKKQATVTPTKIKETPMHYINIALKPIEAKIKDISGEGVSDSKEKAETNARLDLEEKAKNGKIKETEIKRFTGAKGNFKCIILAVTKTEDGYLIPLQQEGSNLFQSPWKPMVKDMFTIIYVVRNLKNGKDFEFKNSEKAIEYIGKNGETPKGAPIPLKAIYKVRDNRQGITKEKDKEFDSFEEADKYFNDKTEENSISEEMNDLYESKLRSIISKLIREELNKDSINTNKKVKTYTQNGDKSYNVTYDDGTKDVIAVSNNAWNEINLDARLKKYVENEVSTGDWESIKNYYKEMTQDKPDPKRKYFELVDGILKKYGY